MTRLFIDAFAAEFRRYRRYADDATSALPFDLLRLPLDPQTNSIAVVMKHLAGNLRSRWTDPFTTDGEKPWRDRDREFIDDFTSPQHLADTWSRGWLALDETLARATDADLTRELRIRGEPHTFALALVRSTTHAAYHTGQIVQAARVLASRHNLPWKTLTVPRGQSQQFNGSLGFGPEQPHANQPRDTQP